VAGARENSRKPASIEKGTVWRTTNGAMNANDDWGVWNQRLLT
jgi:hypothetical protein